MDRRFQAGAAIALVVAFGSLFVVATDVPFGSSEGRSECAHGTRMLLDAPGFGATTDSSRGTEANHDLVQIQLGDQVEVSSYLGGCDSDAALYRWTLAPRSGQAGFPPSNFTSEEATAVIVPPFIGFYMVWSDHLDARGNMLRNGSHELRLEVLTTINFTAPLPTDGSTFTYDFTTFCCPGSTRIYVVPTDALGPQQRWDVRVVVQETGQVVMSDLNGNGWGAGPYEQALGSSFLEEFQLQVVPQGGLPPLGEASVSVEIGQWKFS